MIPLAKPQTRSFAVACYLDFYWLELKYHVWKRNETFGLIIFTNYSKWNSSFQVTLLCTLKLRGSSKLCSLISSQSYDKLLWRTTIPILLSFLEYNTVFFQQQASSQTLYLILIPSWAFLPSCGCSHQIIRWQQIYSPVLYTCSSYSADSIFLRTCVLFVP